MTLVPFDRADVLEQGCVKCLPRRQPPSAPREGLAKARSSGRKLGRPKGSLGVSRLNGKEDNIRRFLDLGVSKTAIAKLTGVSRTTLYSFMRTRGLKAEPLACISARIWSVP